MSSVGEVASASSTLMVPANSRSSAAASTRAESSKPALGERAVVRKGPPDQDARQHHAREHRAENQNQKVDPEGTQGDSVATGAFHAKARRRAAGVALESGSPTVAQTRSEIPHGRRHDTTRDAGDDRIDTGLALGLGPRRRRRAGPADAEEHGRRRARASAIAAAPAASTSSSTATRSASASSGSTSRRAGPTPCAR